MVDRTVARRYAEAFVNALEGSNRLAVGLEELDQVAGMYGQSKELQRFLGSPEIGPEDKERVLDRALAAGAAPEMMGLLRLLLKKDRVENLPVVNEAAKAVSEARQGVVRGQVATAHAISSAETERLAQAVGKAIGKRVILDRQVDPSLIGGVRVTVGGTLLDGSVRAQLENVRKQLKAAKVN
ncbi:MAG: ATP synthase F1 subunit delta [Candidatus Omnitrophota bacterium]|nr:ATP synthase F1 subunit delta [Candidatus Omnitrophota bacterium]